MPEFLVAIPVFAAVTILSSGIKFRKFLNPVSIVLFWWCGWLWVSNLHLTGLFVPGPGTQLMALTMLLAVFLGSKLAFPRSRPEAAVGRANANLVRNSRYLIWLNVLYFPVMTFLLVRAVPLLLSGDPVKYRRAAFGSIDEPNPVFGGSYPQFLFDLLVMPVVFLSLIVGLILYFKFRRKTLLVLSVTLLTMEAAVMLGRFNFYHIIVLAVLVFIFLGQVRGPRTGPAGETGGPPPAGPRRARTLAAMAAGLLLGVGALLLISVWRGAKGTDTLTLVKTGLVEYHTVGFVLFDQELSSPTSRLNSRLSYGRSIIGGLDTLAVVLLRRVNPDLVPMAGENGVVMAEPREAGRDGHGQPILANAFYTILYSLYFDGRYLAVILLPLVFGFLLARSYLDWLKNGSLASLALLLLLMYVGIFSLFQSPVETPRFWGALVLLPVMKKIDLTCLAAGPADEG